MKHLTPRLIVILFWAAFNLPLFIITCYFLPLWADGWPTIIFLGFLWCMAINNGIVAYATPIDRMLNLHYRIEVPYLLELTLDVGIIMMLCMLQHYATAWVWFMQMIAVFTIYERAYTHFYERFMAQVEEENKKAKAIL